MYNVTAKDIYRCRDGKIELTDLNIAAALLALNDVAWDHGLSFAWQGEDKAAWLKHLEQPGISLIRVALVGDHEESVQKTIRYPWTSPAGEVYNPGSVTEIPTLVFEIAGVYETRLKSGTVTRQPWTDNDGLAWAKRWLRPGQFVVSPKQFEAKSHELRDLLRTRGFGLKRK